MLFHILFTVTKPLPDFLSQPYPMGGTSFARRRKV